MAVGEGSCGPGNDVNDLSHQIDPKPKRPDGAEDQDDYEDEEEEEEEEDEPRLKYAPLTKTLSSLYRNGDASSSFLVAGDKTFVGTQNGNIHILSLPAFQPVKIYRGHSASVSSLSISPYPPPLPTSRLDAAQRLGTEAAEEPEKRSPGPKNSPRAPPVPNTSSNQIYIASSSIDGNVCVQSLVDSKDVQLRNFGRPILAVALSPEYKSDRNYLSGGQAGSLILTTGGQTGRSANATTTGAAAAASGWLGSIGLAANTGTDKVLHTGEGLISTIKWSLSGKYVLWVNEEGIKIMRSNLQLENTETGSEWKRLNHIGKPARSGWDDMAGVWKARVEWIDRDGLETDDERDLGRTSSANGAFNQVNRVSELQDTTEDVVVGWGDTVWLIKVYPVAVSASKEKRIGRAEITRILQFNDCTISGISQYTPTLLLVLAYMERRAVHKSQGSDGSQRKNRHNRQNALEPELRLIDMTTNEEVDSDALTMSRYESLTASDYHLGVLHPIRVPAGLAQRGYLNAIPGMSTIGSGMGTIGSGIYTGVETVGQGMWDATMYPTRMLGSTRIFTGTESVRSQPSGTESAGGVKGSNYLTGWIPSFGLGRGNEELNDVAATQGMKIFICSPYDCIVAVKRNLADRVQWLEKMQRYGQAWELLDQHPEAVAPASEPSEASSPPTPSKASSVARSGSMTTPRSAQLRQQDTLAEFFAESSSIASASHIQKNNSTAEKEKRRLGELWLQQLIAANAWSTVGAVASRVLNTTSRWEHWIWRFVENKRYDEISTVIPTMELTRPLPSTIFEMILGHYLSSDRVRFKELIDQWPSDLFGISAISNAIEDQLKSGDVADGSADWRILQECLAKLYLADGRYTDALWCYVRLHDADSALSMIKDQHLVDAIGDDIPSFVLLRITPDQKRTANQAELETLSSEPIKLLVDEAATGVVEPEQVVSQLQESSNVLFVFFYLRALWRGEGSKQAPTAPRVGHLAAVTSLAADEGKSLVEQFADTAIELFAEYDRLLLMEFLQTATSYTFEKAVNICKQRHYVEELVYLLSKTGQVKDALFLIINELKDVSKAIAFAKEQDDKALWDDFLDYSMSRPKFISGLLAEVGTAINPITLVRRIPFGLEIKGLRDGLRKMIKEYDLQDSISTGASKIFYGEVAMGMEALRTGRRRGIKFDVTTGAKKMRSRDHEAATEQPTTLPHTPDHFEDLHPGHCADCKATFEQNEKETLVGFACGHVFHLPHLLHGQKADNGSSDDEDDSQSSTFTRSVGIKVTHARLVKEQIEAAQGCSICSAERQNADKA